MAYYPQFPATIRHLRVHSIVLLTLSPLALAGTFDLHVLAMPPAFNLSHDQTLRLSSLTDRRLATDGPEFKEKVDQVPRLLRQGGFGRGGLHVPRRSLGEGRAPGG